MNEFPNGKCFKLSPVKDKAFEKHLAPMLIGGEQILGSYQTVRDGVVFTNKRIVTISVQGVTGKKKEFTTLPYNKIQAFSIETAGVLDVDSELQIWFSGLGKVGFEFAFQADIKDICRVISEKVMECN